MTNKTETFKSKLKASVREGLLKGIKGLFWLLKIIVPISFVTALLVHFGIIYKLDFILAPAMKILALPSEAALPIIIGLFTGIYGAVASMAVIPLSIEHMTLIAIFLLISHNIIQESMVQGQSGINPFVAAGFRIFISFIVTFVCAKIMGANSLVVTGKKAAMVGQNSVTFLPMIEIWAVDILQLSTKIFLIIMPLMVVFEVAKKFSLIDYVTKLISPIVSILGLSRPTGMLWLTAAFFGLAYGAAVIVEETKVNSYKKEELVRLHLSIGINHAMIEDPALFIPLGLSAVWLWIPRLVAALCAAYLYIFFCFVRRLYVKRAFHKKFCNN